MNIKVNISGVTYLIGLCFLLKIAAGFASEPSLQAPQVESHDILIIGGGISGLTAGYFLKDKDFILLERNDVVGGRATSGNYKQFSYAKGTEYLGEPDDILTSMVSQLGLDLKEIPSPISHLPWMLSLMDRLLVMVVMVSLGI
ncbi:FAD-dependent oxidoreductase [Aeromonas sp. CA23]|uniref:FAD-dependent oxidoreductase n=1 Tax=Aeromonas sp. CA23 TaxID=2033032 RepID=UPI0012FDF8DD|nr:FAD-dependent oxidoreductase [Aeromonas sp. CA23]